MSGALSLARLVGVAVEEAVVVGQRVARELAVLLGVPVCSAVGEAVGVAEGVVLCRCCGSDGAVEFQLNLCVGCGSKTAVSSGALRCVFAGVVNAQDVRTCEVSECVKVIDEGCHVAWPVLVTA